MADPFIGEIRIFGFNYAPRDWAFCNGQTVEIAQNSILYAVIGNNFGGDGRTTLGLPNLMDRAPVNAGRGIGLSYYTLGMLGGIQSVALNEAEMPTHTHQLKFQSAQGTVAAPAANTTIGKLKKGKKASAPIYKENASSTLSMASAAISTDGNSYPHTNMQPYLVSNFCICMSGTFPSRN